jgi:hypothetical protein
MGGADTGCAGPGGAPEFEVQPATPSVATNAVRRAAGEPAFLAIEPIDIPFLKVKKSPCSTGFSKLGDEETRTPDILLAKQALYQLSYTPERLSCSSGRRRPLARRSFTG